MLIRTIEVFDKFDKELQAKFTVEEVGDQFIATVWMPEDGLEAERLVAKYETYSAALANMYSEALEFVINDSRYHIVRN